MPAPVLTQTQSRRLLLRHLGAAPETAPNLAEAVERLARALHNLAESFEVEAGHTMLITHAVAPDDLAALAGLSRSSLALAAERLGQLGVIAPRRQRFILLDPAALGDLAQGARARRGKN